MIEIEPQVNNNLSEIGFDSSLLRGQMKQSSSTANQTTDSTDNSSNSDIAGFFKSQNYQYGVNGYKFSEDSFELNGNGVINGNLLVDGTVTVAALSFTPATSSNVIATINASTEGITIDADNISISGSTTFSSGYDPTSKVDEVAGTYASAASGARVLIFPDANTGIQVIDNGGADVFKALVGGTDVGDVIIGNYSGSQGVKYDKSAGTFDVKAILTANAGSSIATTYLSGIVGLSNTNISAQGWTNTCVFSATDYRVVAWATGVITTAAGTSYNITGANTGNMSASTSYYIYLDIAVSTTLLQVTTTATTAVGSGKILVATAYANADTTSKAQYQVYGGAGGVRLFVDNISANSASTNEFISNSAQIANLVVTDAKINDLAVSKLTAGTITSKAITLAVSAGTGDSKIQAGKTDFTNTENGFILGIDDSDSDKAKFYIGDATTYLNWDGTGLTINGSITTTAGSSISTGYLSGTIAQTNLNVADRGWVQTCVFSVTDTDTVAWGIGTLTSADGTAYSIGAGNTGNMSAKTYIYLDTAVSTTAYQTTTTATTAVGAGKVLVAIAQNNTTEATFQVMQGQGGQNIDASSIVAGSITANEIAASTITAGKMSISTLSSIVANLGSITAGNMTVDTSGYIRGGQTAYNTGTGWWLGYDTSAYKFSIGNPSAQSMTWDGTNLSINGSINPYKSFTAGDPLSSNDAVFIASSGISTITYVTQTTDDNGINIAYDATHQGQGQSFSITNSCYINTITLKLKKFGSPTDSVHIAIQADSSGAPSGTDLTYVNAAGSGIDTVDTVYTYTFTTPIKLTGGTTYWVVLTRTGSLELANSFSVRYKATTNPYAGGNKASWDGTNWTNNVNDDLYFKIEKVFTAGNVYQSSAAQASTAIILGFATATASVGDNTSIQYAGVRSGLSSLTIGSTYYLTDNDGGISTFAGSTSKSIGRALSTTELQLIYTI